MRALREAVDLAVLAAVALLLFAVSPPGRRLIDQLTTPICVAPMP